uniref:PDZ domain-containing protein n=1 Tax=Fundulus heteroclitus TaxID=8078 RepID=A0A3Q2NY47_FUNHE
MAFIISVVLLSVPLQLVRFFLHGRPIVLFPVRFSPPSAPASSFLNVTSSPQVMLNMDDGRSLGLMIRGGAEYGLGIYITGVDPGSAAHVGELKVGDQILEVNDQSFVTISHDEAVSILKLGHHLLMKVRNVGLFFNYNCTCQSGSILNNVRCIFTYIMIGLIDCVPI